MQLIYVSSATMEMSGSDLLFLLTQSRNRNKRQGVTGMLLYAGGNFFQLLEGEIRDVEEIYAAIVNDARNKGNIVLLRKHVDDRTFPEWSMAFKHLTARDRASVEGYSEFLNRRMAPEEFATKADRILELLYQFKKGNA